MFGERRYKVKFWPKPKKQLFGELQNSTTSEEATNFGERRYKIKFRPRPKKQLFGEYKIRQHPNKQQNSAKKRKTPTRKPGIDTFRTITQKNDIMVFTYDKTTEIMSYFKSKQQPSGKTVKHK